MVFNMTRLHMIPNRSHKVKGRGVGSVVIRDGGPGGASSYMNLEDYTHTTGINPFTRSNPLLVPNKKTFGTFGSGLKDKLERLSSLPSKKKNIVMSF